MAEQITGHVAVLGAGRSGRAVASRLALDADAGVDVRVTLLDSSTDPALEAALAPFTETGVEISLGTQTVPSDVSLVVASPGLPPASALMRAARETGAPVISEVELAYRLSQSPWVGITGTNGKTTTTSLIAHLLAEAGLPAEAVGNIGRAAVSVVGETGPATVLVAELSSFQLALTERFHPRVSVLLNITPDHLDWHGSMEAYSADKARIFANQTHGDTAVIDIDDPGSAPYAAALEGSGVDVRTVSLDKSFAFARLIDGVLTLGHGDRLEPLIPAGELGILGDHNISNALAAAAAAHSVGVPVGDIREGLRSFRPIEHRLEPVGVVADAEYFNDSKATNPDAVLKALTAFDERPVVLLLGGRNKHNDFRELALAVCTRCKAAVLFGEAAPELREAFASCRSECEILEAPTLAEAVATASGVARPGDVVLLSPACASFDEFSDYEHRGREFRSMVSALQNGDLS